MVQRVAVIGTGPEPDDPGREGFAMGYQHGHAFERLDECDLVACADIVEENAYAFAETFGLDHVFTDIDEMLTSIEPDLVSICVPPHVHADVVLTCINSGVVEGVHCEKPMAATWAECHDMVRNAEEANVQLTINHQRRFGTPFRRAKALLEDGAIGKLERIEIAEQNLYDAGTHLFDLCGYFTDQRQVEWVLAQIDYREENVWFGAHNENQAIAQWKYEDDVYGIASMGMGERFVDCYLRLRGDEGTLEIGVENGPNLRILTTSTQGWRTVGTDGETIHGPSDQGTVRSRLEAVTSKLLGINEERFRAKSLHERSLECVVRFLDSNEEPELSATNALQATELIFASWESARRRGRIDLPLEIDGNPLEEMVDDGDLLIEKDPKQPRVS